MRQLVAISLRVNLELSCILLFRQRKEVLSYILTYTLQFTNITDLAIILQMKHIIVRLTDQTNLTHKCESSYTALSAVCRRGSCQLNR